MRNGEGWIWETSRGLNYKDQKLVHLIFACRMYNHKDAVIEWQSVPVLFPDDFASALFARGEKAFQQCMLADADAAAFWGHMKTHSAWFQRTPWKDYSRLDKLIPLSLYGDDVQCYKNSEIGTCSIIAWSSDFAYKNHTLQRYFPICVWSEHCSTEHTHEDIMRGVTPRISAMVDGQYIHDWSESGWAFAFSSIQGDLKWIRDHYNLFNFSANDCCSLCGAVKSHEDPSWTIADFRLTAKHVGSHPDLSSFNAGPSVVFSLPGTGPDRVVHDCMHSQLLGTGKVCNGSGIVYLAESSFWNPFQPSGTYPDALEFSLRLAHKDFLGWKKSLKLSVTQPRFTPARLSRKGRQSYACLSCKASPSKAVSMWIAQRAIQRASRADASEMDQMVATCLQTYALALQLLDSADLVMTMDEAQRFCNLTLAHLQTYAQLNKRSRALVGRQAVGKNLWILLPKHRHFHCALKVLQDRINPRASALFAGEDFVGRVSRIARVCHRSTVSERTLQRYLALVHLELVQHGMWKSNEPSEYGQGGWLENMVEALGTIATSLCNLCTYLRRSFKGYPCFIFMFHM